MRNPGLAPISVAPVSSASRHCQRRSGCSGLPSIITMEARTSSAGHQRVPHHPRGGGEPEDPVACVQVPAQAVVLEVFEQDPAVGVHDRLRLAGGAGGEQHAQRVRERHRLEGELTGLGEQLVPAQRVGQRWFAPYGTWTTWRTRRQARADLGDLLAAVDVLAAVAVARDGEQHGGLDLPEPVHHAARAELRGAARPDRAQAGGGEERHQRLRDVRQVRHHPVAPADAEPGQPGPRSRHLVAQLLPGELDPVAGLRVGEHGDLVVLGPRPTACSA